MCVITVYDDEREENIIYISTYDMQGQPKRQTKVAKTPRVHIEHYDTRQNNNFPGVGKGVGGGVGTFTGGVVGKEVLCMKRDKVNTVIK